MGLIKRRGRMPSGQQQQKKGKGKKGAGATGGGGRGNQKQQSKGSKKAMMKDVYEYTGEDDDVEDSNERYAFKPGSHEDEEIDEDMAFDSEDEKRYIG